MPQNVIISKQRPGVFLLLGITVLLLFLLLPNLSVQRANAAENSITVKKINYEDSTITLQGNPGDTVLYFSDSAMKTWESVPGKLSSDRTITMDISWISVTGTYVLNLKGNASTEVTTVVLPKQYTNFKATLNKTTGAITFSNTDTRNIEWRKKGSTVWKTVNKSTIAAELSYFNTNGATVYFRLASIDGTGNTDTGKRPSKEIAISIPKKISAPSIKINGSKFAIPVKKGMAYRIVNDDGQTTDWRTITGSTDLLLQDVAPQVMYANNSMQKEVTLQFRVNATSTSQVSNITTVTVPVQKAPPVPESNGVSLKVVSSTLLSLQVKAASNDIPFEYAIVKAGNEWNDQSANWTAITSGAEISINNKTAPAGSHIYLRKKSEEASQDKEFSLASDKVDLTGANGVSYTDIPQPSALTTLVSIAGICRTANSSGYLTFSLYSPLSTTVSSIAFRDEYGNSVGTVSSSSTVTSNSNSTGTNDKYVISTKITSTQNLDSYTGKVLYADITLANSDVIKSTLNTGVRLYLYPKTVVSNPSESGYSADFKRIYNSKETRDESDFKFKLKFGSGKLIDPANIEQYLDVTTAISSITYQGYSLIRDKDYQVTYGTETDNNGKSFATAEVTVHVAAFENESKVNSFDQSIPLVIKLNNEEILDSGINITMVRTAVMEDIPIAWSISEGSLKETTTYTKTNPDQTTTTVTEDVVSFTIKLTMFDRTYSVGISDVTWGGVSIMGSASVSSGKAVISLSNAKINKLTTNSTETKDVIITLSNGYVIKTGCKLTIIKAS